MRRFALLLALALLFVRCPGGRGEDESQNAPHQTSTTRNSVATDHTTRMNPAIPPGTAPGQQVPVAEPPPIDVQLTEYAIQMPDTLPAGEATLKISNAGKSNHNFAIEGNGVAQKLTSDLTRGDSATLSIDLKPGTYTVYCPVEGHRGKGMERTVMVK
jgi:hypothetical protein